MTSLFVKPATAGARIPNPDRRFALLAQEGEAVPESSFWLRRLAAGDVVACDPPASESKQKPKASE